ncbi:MAG: COG1361 family protein, partial [Methanosarcinaceae archaeon]
MKGTVTRSMVPTMALILAFMLFATPAQAEFVAENANIPEYFNFDENYYTTFGGPDVSATVVGDSEFSCGDSVTLNIDLMNKGVVTGFKSETDDDPVSKLDQKLQQAEMSYESQRTTAIGIVAVLTSSDPDIKVKSGPQEAGSLATGDQTSSPVQFSIDISKNALSGTYPLKLDLYYGYQKNVQVDGDNETDLGVTNMDVGLWYDMGTQNVTIPISVKDEADFEVTNVTGELVIGNEGMLYVTYSNVGELPAKDATVRISAADPFSTTDDQAYL